MNLIAVWWFRPNPCPEPGPATVVLMMIRMMRMNVSFTETYGTNSVEVEKKRIFLEEFITVMVMVMVTIHNILKPAGWEGRPPGVCSHLLIKLYIFISLWNWSWILSNLFIDFKSQFLRLCIMKRVIFAKSFDWSPFGVCKFCKSQTLSFSASNGWTCYRPFLDINSNFHGYKFLLQEHI